MPTEPLTFVDKETSNVIAAETKKLIIAGFTGSNDSAVRHHIEELKSEGIAPPSNVPAFYDVPHTLMSHDATVRVTGTQTSGEVEPVLICVGDDWYLGIGSDHTDRAVERESIPKSKSSCPKPMGKEIVPLNAELISQWDHLTVRSFADDILYQDSSLGAVLSIERILSAFTNHGGTTDGLIMFLGTVPLLGGEFEYSRRFTAQLLDGTDVVLSCSYEIEQIRPDR